MGEDDLSPLDLSVIVPAYQSAAWLPSTLEHCVRAVQASGWSAEVVVVDDGSTDGTPEVVAELARTVGAPAGVPVRVLVQANAGRFLARWAGLQEARAPVVLLLDSRVLLDEGSLAYLREELALRPDRPVWNGHAVTDPTAPLVGQFWEVPTHVFWGGYLKDPRPVEYGLADFNRYPKGTGLFLAPRDVLVEACRAVWPEDNAALASDDTKLIRHIAARTPVRMGPRFRAVYRPRTDVPAFVRHSFGRGTFLVDSFGGTSRAWNALLLGLALAPVLGLALLVGLLAAGHGGLALALVLAGLVAVALPALVAALRGCPRRGWTSYLVHLPVFAAPYWLGLLRGLVVHRAVLRRSEAVA